MRFLLSLLLAGSSLCLAPLAQASDVPKVVVSIKPVHSLVASIMEGVGTPELIVEGAASPHTYNLKPSNAAALQDAQVVFWLGHDLEAFLEKPLEALAGKATVVSFLDMKGMKTLPPRESGTFEHHDHEAEGHDNAETEGEHKDHDHAAEDGHDHAHEEGEEIDAHVWLDPENAKIMADGIVATLSAADPEHTTQYAANGVKLNEKLTALETEVTGIVAPVKDKPFVVFHDAYQYFEQRFGVNVAGSITVSPDHIPGVERISEIHKKVEELGATCVFSEPQFEPKLVSVVIEGTKAKTGVLDPEAGALTEGPDLYFDMVRGIATSIKTCLSGE